MPTTSTNLTEYTAAHESAVFRRAEQDGYLRLSGEHRLDFLNRQTTNDVLKVGPGRAVTTVLTSPTARIEDVLLVVPDGDAVGVVTLPGRGASTARALAGKIFFMDRVTVADLSAEFAQYDLLGPQTDAVLAMLGIDTAPALDGVATAAVAGSTGRVIGRPGLAARLGYRLIVPADAAAAWEDALIAAQAVPIPADVYEIVRVEAGLPVADAELTADYNPLEVNLDWAISHSKGCYTGQEVIARQVNYEKVSRKLVGLKMQAGGQPGAWVLADGKIAGEVTSVALSPRFGPIALAVLRRPHFEPGQQVVVVQEAGETPAQIVALPFGG